MREIKFRAFDNLKKEMIYKVSVFESCAFKNNIHLPTLNGDRNYFINQFTGLVDKNGTEIYEGDIIKHTDPKGYSSKKWEVIFYSGSFFIAGLPNKIRIYNVGERQNKCQVIGNIYQNPELLLTTPLKTTDKF